MSKRNSFEGRIVFVALILQLLLTAGCGPATTSTPTDIQPPAPNPTDTKAALKPTDTKAAPTPDLHPAEGWTPYPDGDLKLIIGDADLKPGYEPMRKGVASLSKALQDELLSAGLKINTARTVVLPEEAVLNSFAGSLQERQLAQIKENDLLCSFNPGCQLQYQSLGGNFLPNGASGQAFLRSRGTPPGEKNTLGEGLYGYIYQLDLAELRGDPAAACVASLQIDFGPGMPLDYNRDDKPDFGFGLISDNAIKPTGIEKKGNLLTFQFNPPVCPGQRSQPFGVSSQFPPRSQEARVLDVKSAIYPVKSLAPDYSKGVQVKETVSAAPIVAANPGQINEDQLKKLLAGPGLILGMLVLETNAEKSLLPPGAYLERAFLKDQQYNVQFIDAATGKEMLQVPMLTGPAKNPPAIIPTAGIYLGSKYCIIQWFGNYYCVACFYYGTDYNSCRQRVDQLNNH
jgi:hypothetical protein